MSVNNEDLGHPDKAARFNKDKPKLSLVPVALTRATARGLEYGMVKYDRDNYRKGLDWYEIIDSMRRHLEELGDPDESDVDLESGLHLVDLICCNAAFLAHAVEHPERHGYEPPGSATPVDMAEARKRALELREARDRELAS